MYNVQCLYCSSTGSPIVLLAVGRRLIGFILQDVSIIRSIIYFVSANPKRCATSCFYKILQQYGTSVTLVRHNHWLLTIDHLWNDIRGQLTIERSEILNPERGKAGRLYIVWNVSKTISWHQEMNKEYTNTRVQEIRHLVKLWTLIDWARIGRYVAENGNMYYLRGKCRNKVNREKWPYTAHRAVVRSVSSY